MTSGIDGALVVASKLRGDEAAQAIQLYLEYTPTPPFHSGSPQTAPPAVLASVRQEIEGLVAERRDITRRVAGKLGERTL